MYNNLILIIKLSFFIINIVSLIFTFINLPHNTIKKIDNNKVKDLINFYKYSQVIYVCILLLKTLYSFYTQYYLNVPSNFNIIVTFYLLSIIFIIIKTTVISIIYFKHYQKRDLNNRMRKTLKLTFIFNIAILFLLLFIILFELITYISYGYFLISSLILNKKID